MKKNHYNHIIGQQRAKDVLKDFASSAGKTICNAKLVNGSAGGGKTTFLTATMNDLNEREFNCIYIPFAHNYRKVEGWDAIATKWNALHGKKRALIIDEIQGLFKNKEESGVGAGSLIKFIMMAANPEQGTGERREEIGKIDVSFSPLDDVIMGATNYPERLEHAFFTRFESVELSPYTRDELTEILHKVLTGRGWKYNDETVLILSGVCKGTARNINKICNSMGEHLKARNKVTISRKDVMQVLQKCSLYLRGLSATDIQILSLIDGSKLGLKQASIGSHFDSDAIAKKSIRTLASMEFILEGTVKRISPKGKKYLEVSKDEGFEWSSLSMDSTDDELAGV